MTKETKNQKKKSKKSVMRRIRSCKTKDNSPASSILNNKNKKNVLTNDLLIGDSNSDDFHLNFNLIVHMQSLVLLLQQTLCSQCRNNCDGIVSVKARDGIYVHIEFICSSCGFITHLQTSPLVPKSKRREINVQLAIGGVLSGLGYKGILKLFGALNLPPPVPERKYCDALEYCLNQVENLQQMSMKAAVEEAVVANGGIPELTISGDGAWLTRGHRSNHGIAAICSTTKQPKIIDTAWFSKVCTKCQGAEGLRRLNPHLFNIYKQNHNCQLNYTG